MKPNIEIHIVLHGRAAFFIFFISDFGGTNSDKFHLSVSFIQIRLDKVIGMAPQQIILSYRGLTKATRQDSWEV